MLRYESVLPQWNGEASPPVHSKLAALQKYWEEQRLGSPLPPRSQFSAERMIPWLPHISLIDIVRDPLRFRFRLMGTGCVRYAGGDHTGKWVDECVGEVERNDVLTPYRECVERFMPVYEISERGMAASGRHSIHRLFLPCTTDGTNANVIVLGVYSLDNAPV